MKKLMLAASLVAVFASFNAYAGNDGTACAFYQDCPITDQGISYYHITSKDQGNKFKCTLKSLGDETRIRFFSNFKDFTIDGREHVAKPIVEIQLSGHYPFRSKEADLKIEKTGGAEGALRCEPIPVG